MRYTVNKEVVKKKDIVVQASANQRKIIIILIAACIHLLLLALLFLPTIEKNFKTLLPPPFNHPEQTSNELKKDWAARQAPAPVVFHDEQLQQPSIEQEFDQTAPIAPEEQKEQRVQKTEENSTQAMQQSASEQEQQEIQEELAQITEQIEPIQIKEVEKPIIKDIKQTKQHVTQKPVHKVQTAQPSTKKRKLNLADITNAFMEKIDNIPMGNLFMQGDISKMPPDKQIIFERYRTKVSTIIAQVCKEYPCPLNNIPNNLCVQLYLALERSGTFKDLHVAQSSGVTAADDYCIFIYKEANKRFPPIPDCLEESLFKGYLKLYYYTPKPGEKMASGNLFMFQ